MRRLAAGANPRPTARADSSVRATRSPALRWRRAVQPPRTLGHEIAGTVVAVGPEAQGVQVGDRRVVFPWLGCGTCSLCREGREHLCNRPQALGIQRDGGFSSHVVVPDGKYLLDFLTVCGTDEAVLAVTSATYPATLTPVGSAGYIYVLMPITH